MIKILHVFSTFNVGGTEVRTADLINNLGDEYHHTIRILKSGSRALQLITSPAKVTVIEGSFPVAVHKAVIASKKEIKQLQPDVIFTYSWGAIEWVIGHALFKQTPLIHAEDGFTDETPSNQKFLRLIIRRLFFRAANKVLLPASVLRKVAKTFWLLPDTKIALIPNSVDINRFKPVQRQSQIKTTLCIIGSLYQVKNHTRLFKIIAALPPTAEFTLLVIGTGVDEARLKQVVKDLSIENKVEFLGLRKDTEKLLEQVDIFCLTSDHEQMPLTVLEAMASGLPIISTRVGDIYEMVSDENKAFIIPIGQESTYIDQLKILMSDSALRNTIGSANRKKCCEFFSNTLMYQRYKELIASCLEKR